VAAPKQLQDRSRADALLGRSRDNLTRARARIVEAADRGATLVCLPELFRSQYFCQAEDHANFDLAEPIPGRRPRRCRRPRATTRS
jgi:predicted amidohydrolase